MADNIVILHTEPTGTSAGKAVDNESLPGVSTTVYRQRVQIAGSTLAEIVIPTTADDTFTFGVSSRFEKLSPEALETWRQILNRVPNSRILFKDVAFERPYSIRRLRTAFQGVENAETRLVFSIGSLHPVHMLGYQKADLFLDPFPHSGGLVGIEQLYMGVPVLTYYGPNMAGRTTSAVLSAIGRGEWIARSMEEYIAKAAALAEDPKPLFDARKTLRQELLDSVLCQPDYVRAVEAAYLDMWRRYVA